MAQTFSRRKFLAAAAMASPMLANPLASIAAPHHVRELGFFHAHTSEKLTLVYWENGEYLADALSEINQLMRDFRTGDVHPIDPGVLDMLSSIRLGLDSRAQFEIISGYRSPATNSMLAAKSTGVSTRSLHMQGRALDIRLSGVATSELRDAATALRAGGVGYYPDSHYVHVDTGRFRTW